MLIYFFVTTVMDHGPCQMNVRIWSMLHKGTVLCCAVYTVLYDRSSHVRIINYLLQTVWCTVLLTLETLQCILYSARERVYKKLICSSPSLLLGTSSPSLIGHKFSNVMALRRSKARRITVSFSTELRLLPLKLAEWFQCCTYCPLLQNLES